MGWNRKEGKGKNILKRGDKLDQGVGALEYPPYRN